MRKTSRQEREAWTAFVEGRSEKPQSKYNNVNRVKEGGYASLHEADTAMKLHALMRIGEIKNLREQVPVTLVPGRDKVRPVIWIADFVFEDQDGAVHYMDAKGCKTAVYNLKKRLAFLLCNIVIEEVTKPRNKKRTKNLRT